MGLNPDTARNIVTAFNEALDAYYGSSVATMDQFKAKRRASYFAGLDIEDDGRTLYLRSGDKEPLDVAISERVSDFMDHNIGDDPEGMKVLLRQKQTLLLKAIVNFVKDLAEMRKWVLWKIEAGQLPPVTIDAWWIKDGVDVMPK